MTLQDHLGAAASLDAWLGRLGQFPGDGWLVIPRAEERLSLETECRPITSSGRELSGEEQEELDELLEQSEWKPFLSDTQLEDILDNLCMQVRNPTTMQVLEAIEHYWRLDAFVKLGEA